MKNPIGRITLKRSIIVGIVFLFLSTAYFPVVSAGGKPLSISRGNWLYVGGSGPGNYTRIQDAIDNASAGYIQGLIDNASNGDTIYIPSGIYYENVIINKSINLIGEDKDTTIIDGGGSRDVVQISAHWVNISGFTIRKSERNEAGIDIYTNYNTISNNTISDNNIGLCLLGNSNCITNNTISNNEDGIYLFSSIRNNIIDNNISSNNRFGIFLDYQSISNNITGNNINTNNLYAIILVESSSNIITGNNISNNYLDGIFLLDSENNIITGNNISNNNGDGIFLLDSENNIITGNNISNNNGEGIYLDDSKSNIITGNNISNNKYGVYHEDSRFNFILKNNFIFNEQDAFFTKNREELNLLFGRTNLWRQNYWKEPRLLPKLIFGEIACENYLYIPWIPEIDWRPAQEPYDIPGTR